MVFENTFGQDQILSRKGLQIELNIRKASRHHFYISPNESKIAVKFYMKSEAFNKSGFDLIIKILMPHQGKIVL